MLTSDDRVAEAIEECATFYAKSGNKGHHMYPVFDLIVTPLVTGSKEYIEWVKLQTQPRDASASFFNKQANLTVDAYIREAEKAIAANHTKSSLKEHVTVPDSPDESIHPTFFSNVDSKPITDTDDASLAQQKSTQSEGQKSKEENEEESEEGSESGEEEEDN